MKFFSDASAWTIVVVVAGTVVWMVASGLRIRARLLEERDQREGTPVRQDYGARGFRVLELAGLAALIGGLAWYVFSE